MQTRHLCGQNADKKNQEPLFYWICRQNTFFIAISALV